MLERTRFFTPTLMNLQALDLCSRKWSASPIILMSICDDTIRKQKTLMMVAK